MSVINPPRIEILDESVSQGRVTRANFTGAGVAASVAGELATITIAGGGAGASATTVEVNLGTTPTWRGKFTITDAAIAPTSKVLCWQAPGPYTGKGTRADEAEMDPILCNTEPATGSAIVRWHTEPMITAIPLGLAGGDGGNPNTAAGINERQSAYDIVLMRRLGKVKGNVKFSYVAFS